MVSLLLARFLSFHMVLNIWLKGKKYFRLLNEKTHPIVNSFNLRSEAIIRYFAKKHGLYGKTDEEQYRCDMIAAGTAVSPTFFESAIKLTCFLGLETPVCAISIL